MTETGRPCLRDAAISCLICGTNEESRQEVVQRQQNDEKQDISNRWLFWILVLVGYRRALVKVEDDAVSALALEVLRQAHYFQRDMEFWSSEFSLANECTCCSLLAGREGGEGSRGGCRGGQTHLYIFVDMLAVRVLGVEKLEVFDFTPAH